jgi:hypothetical protein
MRGENFAKPAWIREAIAGRRDRRGFDAARAAVASAVPTISEVPAIFLEKIAIDQSSRGAVIGDSDLTIARLDGGAEPVTDIGGNRRVD